MKKARPVRTLLNGVIVGASMMLPGVSGGTTAIILGIYDQLISSVSNLFRDFKSNVWFLLQFAVGGLLGVAFLSRIMERMLQLAYVPMMYLFAGAVLGSVPLLAGKAGLLSGRREKPRGFWVTNMFFVLLGLSISLLLGSLPRNQIVAAQGAALYPLLVGVGMIVSVALILPGISTTYMLLVLGLYEPTILAINHRDLAFIAALGVGVIAGILLVTRLLDSVMQKYPRQSYLTIVGFVVAALGEVYPGIPVGMELALSAVALISGIGIVLWLSSRAPE